MRTHLIPAVLVGIAALLCAAVVGLASHCPTHMSVQGRLTDNAGVPVAPGTKQFTFWIYDAESGGTLIWPAGAGEVQTITTDNDGVWDASVGANIPLGPDVFADTSRWLEVKVDDAVNPPEVLSRVRINTAPFVWVADEAEHADSATTVEDNAVTSAKIPAGGIELSDISQSGAAAGQTIKWNGSQWTVSYEMPAGVIVMWSGSAATIPAGWSLCDGTNGTPDLRNRFVFGATNAGGTGGSPSAAVPAHTHVVDPLPFTSVSNSSSYCKVWEVGGQCVAANGHTHSINVPPTTSTAAGGATLSIMPPYYNLAFIMKL